MTGEGHAAENLCRFLQNAGLKKARHKENEKKHPKVDSNWKYEF